MTEQSPLTLSRLSVDSRWLAETLAAFDDLITASANCVHLSSRYYGEQNPTTKDLRAALARSRKAMFGRADAPTHGERDVAFATDDKEMPSLWLEAGIGMAIAAVVLCLAIGATR